MAKKKSFSTKSKSKSKDKTPAADEKPDKASRGALYFVGVMGLITFFAGIGFAVWSFVQYQFAIDGPAEAEQIFTVPKGAGTSAIAAKLESEGLIDNSKLFKMMVRMDKVDGTIKAGEFVIPAKSSMRGVMKVLSEGKAILYPFTAPEGLTSAQIIRAMSGVETLTGDAPDTPAEGTMLPETYMTPRGMSRAALVAKMQKAQKDVLDELWDNRQKDLPIKTKQEAIILASVIEKETGVTSERDVVAGLFMNRLNKGIRLQSDPTIIYGVSQGEPLGRGIRQSEIDRKTDWNTYQMDGLPKTPICNPGREAIAAVLQPAKTDYIFFVADGTGGHVFAKTLKGHNDNVRNWRKIEQQRKRQAAQKE